MQSAGLFFVLRSLNPCKFLFHWVSHKSNSVSLITIAWILNKQKQQKSDKKGN